MCQPFRMFLVCVVAVCAVFMSSNVCWGQQADAQSLDRVSVVLARAREKYESGMETIRNGVLGDLDTELKRADRTNDNPLNAMEAAREQLRAFNATGTLPEYPRKQLRENMYARAAQAMRDEYERAVKLYPSLERLDLADIVTAESRQFASYWDLGPWGENLIEGKSEAERTVLPGSEPLTCPLDAASEYRIEIRAKRVGDLGAMSVELPFGEGKRIAIPTLANDKGEFRVLLTVRSDHISADLGVQRPIDLAATVRSDARIIAMRASKGDVVVESVRVKPVVAGEPASHSDANTSGTSGSSRDRVVASDLMPVGSVWRGSVRHNTHDDFDTRFEVKSVSGDRIIMSGSWIGRVKLEFGFKFDGTRLHLDSVREESNTGGTRTQVSGSGEVSENGMATSYRWRVSGGSLRNQSVYGTMSLERQ